MINLVHPPDELVDVVLAVASVTTLDVVVPLLLEASQRRLQLEWPQEVVGLLEVRTDGQDLMHKVLNADDVVLSKTLIVDNKMVRINPELHLEIN